MWHLERRAGTQVLLVTFVLWAQCLAKERGSISVRDEDKDDYGGPIRDPAVKRVGVNLACSFPSICNISSHRCLSSPRAEQGLGSHLVIELRFKEG